MSFLLTCAQIVLTELVLGLGHSLYASHAAAANMLVALLILAAGRVSGQHAVLPVLRQDLTDFKAFLALAKDIHIATLGLLALLTYGWIVTAAYYLPPRGIDDLTYHLPTIFEYIQSHEIRLLPVALRHHFAFPENAELLFMWPTLFSGTQRMVDGLNIPFVFVTVLAVYGLLRHFEVTARDALFAAMLYAMCPVVMMQAGVNYIDIIVSLFFLLALYFSVRFHATRSAISLLGAGIAIGLMLGMKYTAILLVIPLQMLIVPGLFTTRRRLAAPYAAVVLVTSGWWYVRNMIVLHDPFYPMNFLGPLVGKPVGAGIFSDMIINLKQWPSRYLAADSGVGSCDGGFGLVFWGLGLLSWVYYSVYLLLRPARAGLAQLVVLACLPVGFLLLLAVPQNDVNYVGRMAMFVVAVGLFALCRVMQLLNNRVCSAILKGVCIVLSVITVGLMFEAKKPHYRLGNVVIDRINDSFPSEFRYTSYEQGSAEAAFGYVWDLLDILTRDDDTGLYCSLLSDRAFFFPSSIYGSKLQNRIAYSHKDAREEIDAYVGMYYPKSDLTLDDGTTAMDIVTNDNYVVASHWTFGCLILHRDVYNHPRKQQLLAKYYKTTWPHAVTAALQLAPALENTIPVITSSPVGYGLRYIAMRDGKAETIVMTPSIVPEEEIASARNIPVCYSIGRPLSGFTSKALSRVVYRNSETTVYLNKKI